MIIVCGPQARRGANHGVVLERVRNEDDESLSAGEHFERMGGYLTSYPVSRDGSPLPVGVTA